LIHRVIIPDVDYPKEHAVLVTDKRLLFIRQEKVRKTLALRGEMRWGSEIASPVVAKSLSDYEDQTIESLSSAAGNFTIATSSISELILLKGKHKYHVHQIELKYRTDSNRKKSVVLYMVPLGTYVKPMRATQSREAVLRDYAVASFKILEGVLPADAKRSELPVAGTNEETPSTTRKAERTMDEVSQRASKRPTSAPIWHFEEMLQVPFVRAKSEFLAIREGEFSPKTAPLVLSGLKIFDKVKRVVIQGGPTVFRIGFFYDHYNMTVTASIDEQCRVTFDAPWWYRGEYALAPTDGGGTRLVLDVYNKASKLSAWALPLVGLETEKRKQFAAMGRLVKAWKNESRPESR